MSNITFLPNGHLGSPREIRIVFVEGSVGALMSDIICLLRGLSGRGNFHIPRLCSTSPDSVINMLVSTAVGSGPLRELSATGAKRGVRFLQLPDWSPPDNPF